jgi:23S rRNA (pseudouridine1915-N3)-methyltransferase
MKIVIAAPGRFRSSPEKDLYEKYIQRLPWAVSLIEIDEKKTKDTKQRRAQEGGKLANAVPKGAIVVALDEGGKTVSSVAMAEKLRNWQDEGTREIAFLIGGADGLDRDLLQRADLALSFGAMTWPHLLVRAMLAEQLYRSSTLISGHPYHRA